MKLLDPLLLFLLKKYLFIFGSVFQYIGSFIVVYRLLSSFRAWAPQMPGACGNLSSLTRDQTCIPCIGRQILNHWTTREILIHCSLTGMSYGVTREDPQN